MRHGRDRIETRRTTSSDRQEAELYRPARRGIQVYDGRSKVSFLRKKRVADIEDVNHSFSEVTLRYEHTKTQPLSIINLQARLRLQPQSPVPSPSRLPHSPFSLLCLTLTALPTPHPRVPQPSLAPSHKNSPTHLPIRAPTRHPSPKCPA